MSLEDRDTDLLFLLEVVVDSVVLRDPSIDKAEAPLRVGVNFFDLPMLEIRQEEFSDALTSPKDGTVFSCGKSCMFPMAPGQLLSAIEETPLVVTVYRHLPHMVPPDILGHATIALSDIAGDMVRAVARSHDGVPVARFLRGVLPLLDINGETVGNVSLFVRLSCLGQTVLSQVQILDEEAGFMFKNTLADGKMRAQSRDAASPAGPLTSLPATSMAPPALLGAPPMVYSLEESKLSVQDDDTSPSPNKRIRQTMMNVLYELDKIGSHELLPFRAVMEPPSESPDTGDNRLWYKLSDVRGIDGEVREQVPESRSEFGRSIAYCTPHMEQLRRRLPRACAELPFAAAPDPPPADTASDRGEVVGGETTVLCACDLCRVRATGAVDRARRARIESMTRTAGTPRVAREEFSSMCNRNGIYTTETAREARPAFLCPCHQRREHFTQHDYSRIWGTGTAREARRAFLCPCHQRREHVAMPDQSRISGTWTARDSRRTLLCACEMAGDGRPTRSCACDQSGTRPVEPAVLGRYPVLCACDVGRMAGGARFGLSPRVGEPCFGRTCPCSDTGVLPSWGEACYPPGSRGAGLVVWRMAEDQVCSFGSRKGTRDQEVLRGYTPSNPPVRYDTTSKLSPVGRGEETQEAYPHPPVRYDTTSVLSPAHNHPPVRYDTTGRLSPAAAAFGARLAGSSPQRAATSSGSKEHVEELLKVVTGCAEESHADVRCTCCCCCCCRCTKCACRIKVSTLQHGKAAKPRPRARYRPWTPHPSLPRRPHSCLVPESTGVPPHMGWLWTSPTLPVRAGWRPGYLSLSMHTKMAASMGQRLAELKSGTEGAEPRARSKVRPARRAVSGADQSATMHVVQRDGRFYVTLASRDPGAQPLRFKVPGCDEVCPSDSNQGWPLSARSSDINLEFLTPADLVPPVVPVETRCVSVQYDERHVPASQAPPPPQSLPPPPPDLGHIVSFKSRPTSVPVPLSAHLASAKPTDVPSLQPDSSPPSKLDTTLPSSLDVSQATAPGPSNNKRRAKKKE